MINWFGKQYAGAPVYSDCPQTETPAGTACQYCEESIQMGDDGWVLDCGSVLHRECFLRMIVGSVAHQQGRCSCCGGDDRDEEGVTRRQAARAALEYRHGARH